MVFQLTQDQLQRMMPACKAAVWTRLLNDTFTRFGVDCPARAAAFIAQVGHESGDCSRLEEGLNYSAERLMVVWPKRFTVLTKAEACAHNPSKLANRVYADRMGNGPEGSGDGFKYRGRGLLQLTGRSNYRAAGVALGLDMEGSPDILQQLPTAALAAGWFWQSRGCNELADMNRGDHEVDDFTRITMLINGGKAGLDDRLGRWARAKRVLTI